MVGPVLDLLIRSQYHLNKSIIYILLIAHCSLTEIIFSMFHVVHCVQADERKITYLLEKHNHLNKNNLSRTADLRAMEDGDMKI